MTSLQLRIFTYLSVCCSGFFYVDSSTNYCILGNFPLEKFKKNSFFYKNVRKVSGSRESSLIVLVSYDVEVTLKVCKAV